MKTKHVKGFSLIELMITLLVGALVLGIGIPTLQEFIATNQMAASVNNFVSSVHVARSEAIKRRANATLCASADWNSATPTCAAGGKIADGWIVFIDCSVAPPPLGTCGAPNFVVDAFDTVISAYAPMDADISTGFTTSAGGGVEYIAYSANGFPRNIAGFNPTVTDFQFCDERGDKDVGGNIAAGRWIQVTATGRPQIYRDKGYVQGAQNPLGGC
jgi:type IV fimbrial biogenesis protein FimT